jgi:hypothetical protein
VRIVLLCSTKLLCSEEDTLETKSIRRLLGLLALGGKSGWVQVYPPPSLNGPGNENPPPASDPAVYGWFAVLYLREGELEQCDVYNANKRLLLSGRQAYDFLDQRGHLFYDEIVEQSLPHNVQVPQHNPSSNLLVATHIRLASDQDVLSSRANLSREAWRVLSLVDGKRSDDEVIKLSGSNADDVIEILDWLQQQGWIK